MAVYVLELEDEHFYIGWSSDPCARVAEHFLGRGARWTKLHRPLRVLSVTPGGMELENPTTILTMVQHNWRKVRGGSWSDPDMTAMPMALAKAFCNNPVEVRRKPTPKSYDYSGHAIQVDFYKAKWRSRVSGPRAVRTLKTCVKTFRAKTEEEARSKAEKWLGFNTAPDQGQQS